jgi:hypothetical protein
MRIISLFNQLEIGCRNKCKVVSDLVKNNFVINISAQTVKRWVNRWTRVKKSESYFVNLHDGFPAKSMKNVPNIRQFSRTYTKKIHLSYFTFDSVQRTTYTYNSIKKIIDLVLFLILISIRSILVKY